MTNPDDNELTAVVDDTTTDAPATPDTDPDPEYIWWPSNIDEVVPLSGNVVTFYPPQFDGCINLKYAHPDKVREWELRGMRMSRDLVADDNGNLRQRDEAEALEHMEDVQAVCLGPVTFRGTTYTGDQASELIMRHTYVLPVHMHALRMQQLSRRDTFRRPPSSVGGNK